MELLVNDLSIHQQFHDPQSFREAFAKLMAMRGVASRFGRDVYCHQRFLLAQAVPGKPLRQVLLQVLSQNERRAAMRWLTRGGPFWDDLRRHGPDDYLECRCEVVTDSAVAEAAHRKIHGADCGLISVTPSDWNYAPVTVTWRREDEDLDDRHTELDNWWNVDTLEDALRNAEEPLRSWGDLRRISASRFERLVFAEDCFEPLDGLPFTGSAAERFLVLLDVLDRLVLAHDVGGAPTPEARQLLRDYFTGERALFSDSSETEKHAFRQKLTFRHPRDGGPLFCPWHGKVSRMTLRLHYSWSRSVTDPVYVVYAGPKITRR